MAELVIPSEDAIKLYQEHSSTPVNGVRFVTCEFYEEWRWGNRFQVIVQDVLTDKFYSSVVTEQSGEYYHLDWEDEESISFDEVVPVETITTTYKLV